MAGLISLILASMVAASQGFAAAESDSTRGRVVYNGQGCADCHGYVGQGSNAGPRLSAKAIPISMLTRQLRHPSAEMPPYSEKVLGDDDVAALQEFIATMK